MNIESMPKEIANLIKADDFFKDIKIIKPFANTSYSGNLSRNVVAIYLGETSLDSTEMGDSQRAGKVGICADIYVPLKNADFAKTIFCNICRVLGEYNVVSIKSEKCEYSKSAKAVVMKSEFIFKSRFEFGGESGE